MIKSPVVSMRSARLQRLAMDGHPAPQWRGLAPRDGKVSAEHGGSMAMTRRELLCSAGIVLSAAFALALPQGKGALEVTYYYLPG